MSDFIRLNNYDVKDKYSRDMLDNLKKALKIIENDKTGELTIERLDKLEIIVNKDINDKNESLENIKQQIDSIHKHSNKIVLDQITAEKLDEWSNKSDFSGKYEDLKNKPNLQPVATSGKYEDLILKPELHKVAISGKLEDMEGTLSWDQIGGIPELGLGEEVVEQLIQTAIPKKISAFENDVPYFCNEHFIDDATFNELLEDMVFMPPENNLTDKDDDEYGRPEDEIVEGDSSLLDDADDNVIPESPEGNEE